MSLTGGNPLETLSRDMGVGEGGGKGEGWGWGWVTGHHSPCRKPGTYLGINVISALDGVKLILAGEGLLWCRRETINQSPLITMMS